MKSFREKQYLSRTDQGFQNYVTQRRSGMTAEELQEEKLNHMDDKRFVKTAKQYR